MRPLQREPTAWWARINEWNQQQRRGFMKAPKLPSDRSFGLLFTVVFAVLAAWAAWKGGKHWWYSASISGLFLVLSLTFPKVLHPLNVVWMKFGLLLGMIVSPIVLGVIYFLVVTPFALVMK